jgi:crotonobetainyl-CoA:carnitine CoA-transferase CaiB-like acyl-CoA transferase
LEQRIIDVALNESMLSMMESLLPDYEAYGVLRKRTGGRMQGIAPSNAYLCGDGASIVIAGNGDAIFRRLMRLIGRDDLAEHPDYSDNARRWDRRDELDAVIGGWTGARTATDALAALAEASVPSGRINTAEDIVEDEQYLARGMIQRLDVHNGERLLREVGFPGVVPVLGEASLPVRNLGPDLGEHTEEILGDLLGWGAEEIHDVVTPDTRAAS